jgi:hypothetical protein
MSVSTVFSVGRGACPNLQQPLLATSLKFWAKTSPEKLWISHYRNKSNCGKVARYCRQPISSSFLRIDKGPFYFSKIKFRLSIFSRREKKLNHDYHELDFRDRPEFIFD